MVFLPLFLIHPYTLANTMLPDIDQTVMPVTILLFIYFLIRLFYIGDTNGNLEPKKPVLVRSILVLSLLFALNLWTKLTTPLALLPTTFCILLLIGYTFRKSIFIVMATAFVGVCLFLSTYWFYCYYFGLPFEFTFKFLVHSFTKGTTSPDGPSAIFGKVARNFAYVKQYVNWVTLPFLFALFASLACIVVKKNRGINENILLALSLLGLFVSLFYLCLTGPWQLL